MNQKTIKALELERAIESGVRYQLVDVRSPQEDAAGHVPCAINLPMEQVETRLADMHVHDPVVLICESGTRAQMTSELLDRHRNDWLLLDGGTSAWRESGLPVVGGMSTKLPLIRQVQLTIGPLSLIGSVLAILVNPYWAVLPGFIGAGLIMAGATGRCGMASLLGLMPWNRPRYLVPGANVPTMASEGK